MKTSNEPPFGGTKIGFFHDISGTNQSRNLKFGYVIHLANRHFLNFGTNPF